MTHVQWDIHDVTKPSRTLYYCLPMKEEKIYIIPVLTK